MRTRLVLFSAALALASSVALAQPQVGQLPQIRPQTTQLPTPQGAAGEGLYVAGADRVALSSSNSRIVSLALPRGNYQVIARAVIANDRDTDGAANCWLRSSNSEIDYVSITLPPMSRREFMLMGVAASPGLLGGVELHCQGTAIIAATARWARIHATAIARATGEAPAGH